MDVLILLIVIGTSIWVLVDAKTIGVKKGQIQGLANIGPWGWFFVCLLLWIVGFPFYLAKRSKFKRINSKPERAMKFDWQNWSIGGKLIFIACCVATVSMFMKWVDLGIISQSGFSQGGFLFLGFWVYPMLMLFKNQRISRIWGLACSILSVISTLLYITSKSIEVFQTTVNAAGTGAYLFLFASIALIVGIIKYEPAGISGNNTLADTGGSRY